MSPQPWARTGPGTAKDGKPRFDLERFDEAFFSRLRERVVRAGEVGIYVDVLLFDGWALHLSPPPDHIEGHPFHAGSNVNGVSAESINDLQVLPLDPQVEAIQRAFITKVVDTLHDLPNVLWEVANESSGDGSVTKEFAEFLGMDSPPSWGDSTAWQYWVIDVVQQHERDRGYDAHPIGMTMQFPVQNQTEVNEPLLASRADWISPGYDDERFTGGRHPMEPGAEPSRWLTDPPAADGRKVVISDTDHYAPGGGDALWAWKSFVRGHHPILMDFGLIDGPEPTGGGDPDAGVPGFDTYEPARYAMGDTRRFAERMSLVETEPRQDTASTGYALVTLGREVLALDPTGGSSLTVELGGGPVAGGVVRRAATGRDGRRPRRGRRRRTAAVLRAVRWPGCAVPEARHAVRGEECGMGKDVVVMGGRTSSTRTLEEPTARPSRRGWWTSSASTCRRWCSASRPGCSTSSARRRWCSGRSPPRREPRTSPTRSSGTR